MTEADTQTRAWARQITQRDAVATAFVDRIAVLVTSGRLDEAEELFRRSAFAGITSGGHLLTTTLIERASTHADRIVSIDRPATLIALAIARLQTAGDLGGLDKLLAAAIERLRARKAADPAERARDLSLAAIACQLRHDVSQGTVVVARGADFVLELGENILADADPDARVVAAVCDLAFAAFLIGDVPRAAALWMMVRGTLGDPREPALIQADWGLAIIGTVIGVRDLVSPTMHRFFGDMRETPNVVPEHLDPWWGMVTAARAWTELDLLEPDRGLEITRIGVSAVTMPQIVGPLILVRAFSLVAAGRPRAALEFLRWAPAELPHESPDASWQWRAMVHVVAGVLIGDDEAVAEAQRLLAPEPLSRAMTTAYVELVNGRDALAALGEPPSPAFNARYRFLYWILAAGAHAQHGNRAATVAAMEHAASIGETHPVAAVTLILPDEILQSMRAAALAAGQPGLLDRLPEHTRVYLPVRSIELTPREEEVLRLLRRGLTNAQIAAALFISANTVKFHVANLLRRLGVASREEAAASRISNRNYPGKQGGSSG